MFSRQVIFLLKLLSILFIVSGFTFGGFYLSSRQTGRVKLINDILLMLTVIETQIRYACLPVSDLLRIICDNDKLNNLQFIRVCREKTLSGIAFPVAWRESIEFDREICRLLYHSKPYLMRLGEDIGTTDMQGQISCCEYYRHIFQKELSDSEEKTKKYSKLYPALGLMTGISAAIIII